MLTNRSAGFDDFTIEAEPKEFENAPIPCAPLTRTLACELGGTQTRKVEVDMTTPETPPTVAEFLNTAVQRLSPEMSLQEVIEFLLKHNLSSAPVVEATEEGEGRLVGFVSERDCLAALSQESYYDASRPPENAGTIMKRGVVCVLPDTDLFTAASIFINHGYRHLPVVKGGILQGILSRRDVLRAVTQYAERCEQHSLREHFPPDTSLLINHRFI